MAERRSPRFRFQLRATIELSDKKLKDVEKLKNVQRYLAPDITLLNKHMHFVQKVRCVSVSDITVENDHLCFGFLVETLQELNDFFALSESGKLSTLFTQYAEENYSQILASSKISTKVKCHVQMDQETLKLGKIHFAAEVLDDDSKSNSQDKGQTGYGHNRQFEKSAQSSPENVSSVEKQNSSVDLQYLKTELILPLPKLWKLKTYESVSVIVIYPNDSDEEQKIQMKPKTYNLWSADIFTPMTRQIDQVRYYFEVVTGWYGFPGRNISVSNTQKYALLESATIRKFLNMNEIHAVDVVSHLKDIVIYHSETKTMAECTIQIENICKHLSFKAEVVKSIYITLLGEVDRESQKQLLLSVVVFGNLFRSYDIMAKEILNSQISFKLLNSLTYFSLSDLTTSCSNYLFDVAASFCRIALGNRYCFLSYVSIVYPFFEEEFVAEKLSVKARIEDMLLPETVDEETDGHLFRLFDKVYQRLENAKAKQLLEQLVCHIPIQHVLKAVRSTNMQSALKDDELKYVKETLLGSVRAFLLSTKRNAHDITHFMTLTNFQGLTEEIGNDLEKAVINCVKKASLEDKRKLTKMVFEDGIFISMRSQLCLVQAFTALREPDLHFLLFDMLTDDKFREAALNANIEWLIDCFDNAMCSLKREKDEEKKLGNVYKYLAKALEIGCLRNTEEVAAHIDKLGIEYLKIINLRKLMRMIKIIESLAEENRKAEDLFKLHIQTILKEQYASNYYEVLLDLCATNGKLRINSGVTVSIVTTVINICMPKNEQLLERFKEMVSQCQFWMAVLMAEGKEIHRVKETSDVRSVIQNLKTIAKRLECGELPYSLFTDTTCKSKKEEIISLLLLAEKVKRTDMNRRWSQTLSDYEAELLKIASSSEVLKHIQTKMQIESVAKPIGEMRIRLNNLHRDILAGKISAKDLKDQEKSWGDLINIPERCLFLKPYVKSNIFWTSCCTVVKAAFEEKCRLWAESRAKEESLESIHRLFGENDANESDDECEFFAVLILLEVFTDHGITEYKQAWESIMKNQDKDVGYVLTLLQEVDIDAEIRYAEDNLHQPLPGNVKKTLRRLQQIDRYDNLVDILFKTFNVFSIEPESSKGVYDAITTFQRLQEKTLTCPFATVEKPLAKIESIANDLQPDAIEILGTLSGSTSLIEFLRNIVDEDIRNLIDAVEDISEQHVQESTVSALIEVKSFLHGLLIKSPKELNAQDFLDIINKQTKATSAKNLPAKIDECMNSLHNLKSLYGNVANRGEMTAEIIGNIISKGKFRFDMEEAGKCDFHVTYKHRSVLEKQSRHKLIDLRSRALLLMNTRTKIHERKIRGEDLEKFVSYTDLSIEINTLLSELHQSGNMSFITYSFKTNCLGLSVLQEQLQREKMEWNDMLQKSRNQFYLLNFIHGPEIHLLYHCFERKNRSENVTSLLRFIHPDLQLEPLLDIYDSHKGSMKNLSNEVILQYVGRALHFGFEGKKPVERPLHLPLHSKRLTETVQNGRLYVAVLEEHSNQVVKTLLYLYMNTTQMLPEPHQVIFCTKYTTWNELELLLYRCLGSFTFTKVRQLFCIANVEMLPNELQFRLVEKLRSIETNENFYLSLIFRGSDKHSFLDELSTISIKPSAMLSDEQLRQAFQSECPGVVTYTSSVPGLGKTNKIKDIAFTANKSVVKLHLSGPIQKKAIIERLASAHLKKHHALHIDIGSVDNVVELDTFMFELIILQYVTASCLSVRLQSDLVFIEVANTINDTLRNSLTTVMAFKREHLRWENYNNFMVSMETNSPVQVVCQYLDCLEKGVIDEQDVLFGVNNLAPALQQDHCRKLLRKYFNNDDSLSFTVVNIFLQVLADQLKKMSCSSFFRVSRIVEMTGHKTCPVMRSTLVKAMIEASKEFSSRSVKTCRSTQMSTIGATVSLEEEIATLSCTASLAEMAKQRVDEMVRWEDSNHLIFVFHSQNVQTISPMYRSLDMVPNHVKTLFESQMKRKMQDFSCLTQNELLSLLQKVARKNPLPISSGIMQQLTTEYALTPDNLLKMVLIMLRVNSNIPVVVMGETGCGKTSLIRYLAKVTDVAFVVLSIHAGIEEEKIIQIIKESNELACTAPDKQRWLFLDEINTSEHIGLMTDAICGRTCLGKELAPNLVVMGACNPYKLRTESAISTAGLKGKVQTDELSKLVYRVLPLPECLVDYIWDFGTLSDNDEFVYIRRMINDLFPNDEANLNLLQQLLSVSQKFVRKQESVSYCVSLRDIQRCKTLIRWFLETLPKQHQQIRSDLEECAIIHALGICYHSRFSSKNQRQMYRKELEAVFYKNGQTALCQENIKRKIEKQQKDILRRMDLPAGTARNTSLQENVFVILVCLLNKIPIFLVGKPGCSKSLSMQVIRSNLRGKDSKDTFFKSLPQLYCVSFQGSESSTSDGIIKVFEKALRYQQSNNAEEVLSVVILDEIGLAEVSRFNPLKVLHSLLEPDGRAQPDVAVVGISNWALDASKMNRAIHLSRPDMDEDELYQTGVSISESFIESKQLLKQSRFASAAYPGLENEVLDVLRNIAVSYLNYVHGLTFKNFYGLRDYYSLVKFVSRGLLDESVTLDKDDIDMIVFEGLQRNFGGLPAESGTLLYTFHIQAKKFELETKNVLKLLEDNINDQLARHLMCITSGDSALGLVESLLTGMKRDGKVVIFGSHFEEDQTSDYNYRILSRIILCMEQGFVLILKDLENIYGSLYDMLNQNYTVIGKKKHCRVALGHYSNPICHVHDSFRCIVLIDENNVNYSDPPFLNRFEKQHLKFTDTVNNYEADLVEELNCWTKRFSNAQNCSFDEKDCFPIYSQDMIPSLVIKTSRAYSDIKTHKEISEICKTQLLQIVQSDAVFRLEKNSYEEMCKNANIVKDKFLKLPVHSGIGRFVEYQLSNLAHEDTGLLTVVLTNTSMHCQSIYKIKKYDVQVEKLGAFKSEKQLNLRIQKFWTEASEMILFLHCSAVEDEQHIPLAKATIDNIRTDVLREQPTLKKHAYLIVHLDQRQAERKAVLPINFLSGWEIVTLDSLAEPEITLPELSTLSLLEAVERRKPLSKCITEQLFWSFSRIRYEKHGRDLPSIQAIIQRIQDSEALLQILEQHVLDWISDELKQRSDREWLTEIATSPYCMNTSGSFLVALEQEILNVIKEPICKLIYQMENMNVIACFFCEDKEEDRKKSLENMLRDDCFFSISNVHNESGPECFLCTAADLPLRMPFSKFIFDSIENTKEDFMDTYNKVKEKCDLDEDDVMSPEVLEVLFSKHEGVIEQHLPDLSKYLYGSICDDYFHDFCYFVSQGLSSKITPERKCKIIRWLLEQEINFQKSNLLELTVKLHASYWMYFSVLSAEYTLMESCSEIFKMDDQIFQCLSRNTSNRFEETAETEFNSDFPKEHSEFYDTKIAHSLPVDGSSADNMFGVIKKTPTIQSAGSETDIVRLYDNYSHDHHIHKRVQEANECTAVMQDSTEKEAEKMKIQQDVETDKSSVMALDSSDQYEKTVSFKQNENSHFVESDFKVDEKTSMDTFAGYSGNADVITEACLNQIEESIYSSTCAYKSVAESEDMSDMSEINTKDIEKNSSAIANVKSSNLREELVKFVSTKLLPSQLTLASFATVDEWRNRVSTVLINAVKISSDPSALHSLRFCYDLVSELDPCFRHSKLKNIAMIGDTLQTKEESGLHSRECLLSIYELIYKDPRLPTKDAKYILSSYLNKCLAADAETEAVSNFLQLLPMDRVFIDNDFDVFKAPLQLVVDLINVEDNDNLFINIINVTNDDILSMNPTLEALDTALKALNTTDCSDLQFPVLVVDILEELYNGNLSEILSSDTDEIMKILLSVQNILLGVDHGLQFLCAVSFYKTFIRYFVDLVKYNEYDTSKCTMLLPVVKSIIDKESESPISVSMKQYFIKELGQGMLPWTLYKTCKTLSETFDFLKSWTWTENYLCQCMEGNPLLLFVPHQAIKVQECLNEIDKESQFISFQELLKCETGTDGLLAFYAVSLSRFYIARRYKQQDDTLNHLAKSLMHVAEMEKMDQTKLHLLAYILGVRIFPCLDLNEYSSDIFTTSAIFSTSLFAMLVSNQTSADECQLPLLVQILLDPCSVEVLFMTSLMNLCKRCRKSSGIPESREYVCVTCACEYRLIVERKGACDRQCPVCSTAVKKLQNESEISGSIYAPGTFASEDTNKGTAMSEIAHTIIHICIQACLLGSLLLETSKTEDLKHILAVNEKDDMPRILMDAIQTDVKDLQHLLGMNCHGLNVFLYACLLSLKDHWCEEESIKNTEEQAQRWIDTFVCQIEPLLRDRYGTVVQMIEKQCSSSKIPCDGPELKIHEYNSGSLSSDERKNYLPSLFRMKRKSDFTSFTLDLHVLSENTNHPYPFLVFVLEVLPDLAVTGNLLNIVRWHISTALQIECRMKKRQCLEMTVEDFIHYDKNEKMRKRLQDRFENLQKSLHLLEKAGYKFDVLPNRITSQTKMKNCLILDSNSALYTVSKFLCEVQNKFLDEVLRISVKNNCMALEFLSNGNGISAIPSTSIVEIKYSSIVSYVWEDELLTFSHADLRYGHGAHIKYEFEAIEKMLALKLVSGKSYILLENHLPPVTFVDEFYKGYGKMAKEIDAVLPQKPLSAEIVHGIKEKREQHPRLTVELITHVGVLISLVKKTKGNSEMPLVEYVDIWKRVLTSPMPSELLPVPENGVKLCHLIALYGLLEELNAESLIDSLDEQYRKPISFEIENQLNNLLGSNRILAGITLTATKRFIYRCLASGDADIAQPLSEYLADASFWPSNMACLNGDSEIKSPADYLPKDLKVQHVSKMVLYMESKLKELTEKDLQLNTIATSFASRGNRTTAEKKRKMARKRVV